MNKLKDTRVFGDLIVDDSITKNNKEVATEEYVDTGLSAKQDKLTLDSGQVLGGASDGSGSPEAINTININDLDLGTGTVTQVKLNNFTYNPDGDGVIYLPAYPTVPTYSSSTSIKLISNSFQRAALEGDVISSQNSNETTIADNVVTFDKIQKIATGKVLGRTKSGAGEVEELDLVDINDIGLGTGTSITYSGSDSIILNGNSFQRAELTGDVTADANSNETTIADNVVTNAKILNSTIALTKLADIDTKRLLGRYSTGRGNVQPITIGSNLTLSTGGVLSATNTVYTHPNSGVTAGTYRSVTVDAKGHITAGTNPTTLTDYGINLAAGDIPNLSPTKITQMDYFNYAGSIYGDKYSLLESAWEHSLTVDPSEISATSSSPNHQGTAQYPNGETEGVIIPQGVTSIGQFAFRGWPSNNQPLVIPNSVTSIGAAAFYSWSSNNQPLVIPNNVTSIGIQAFEYWTANNQPLVIPNSVTSISLGAFSGWSSNNHPLIIPNSVITIGSSVFNGWTANSHPLVIPSSVTSIGGNAFNNWRLVPYVEMKRTTPPILSSANAFSNQNNAPIYVPDESVEAYKTATNWSALAHRIFPISDKADLIDDVADLQENKQDKLVAGNNITIDENTNTISASGGGGGGGDNYININYADLVALRDSNSLKEGAFYRITDYETTTVQADTRSAGHQFDIIVQALDEKTLSENASARNRSTESSPSWFEHNESDPAERYFYVDSVVIAGLILYRWLSEEESNNVNKPQYLLTEMRDVGIGDVVWGYQVIDDGTYGEELYDEVADARTIINVANPLPWFEHNKSSPAERFFYVDSVVIAGLTLHRWVSYEELYAGNWMAYHTPSYLLTEMKDVGIGDVVWGWQIIDDGTHGLLGYEGGEDREKTIINVGEGYMSGPSGSDYFAKSKLEAWELKYCLDNDTNRFAWADEVNGKGVIYYMKDEYNNEVPYDFKNIQFKRDLFDDSEEGITFANIYFYTFSAYPGYMADGVQGDIEDATIITKQEAIDDLFNRCYSNVIKPSFHLNYSGSIDVPTWELNNTIFVNKYASDDYYFSCDNNTFGNNCSGNTIGNDFSDNTIGNSFRYNTIGNDCSNNTIENNAYGNTIGNDFSDNTIGNGFSSNTIGNDFRYNTIGNDFRSNATGNSFYFNTVGNSVQYIQFSLDGTSANQIRYLYLKDGLSGASSNNRLDLYYDGLYGREYPTTFELIANGNIISSWEESPLTRTGKVKETKTTATWSDSAGGTWKEVYSGPSGLLSKDDHQTLTLNKTATYYNRPMMMEIKFGTSLDSYTHQIVTFNVGNIATTISSKTLPRTVSITDFDGRYFKTISVKVYVTTTEATNSLRVGHVKTLVGDFADTNLPGTLTWTTESSDNINVYIGKIWVMV